MLAPVFGSEALPRRIKISIIIVASATIYPLAPMDHLDYPGLWGLVGQLVVEITIGIIIGFILMLALAAIQLAGEFIDRRMGFFLANVMAPQFAAQVPLIGQFKNILAILIFLAMNGHHKLFRALLHSFEVARAGEFTASGQLVAKLMRIVGDLFPRAFQIALPIMGTIFIIDVAFGLAARAVPQMNIFIVGLPARILTGMTMLFIALPNFLSVFRRNFMEAFHQINDLIRLIGAGG